MLQVKKVTTAFYRDKQVVQAELVLCAGCHLHLDAVGNCLPALSAVIHQQKHQWRHLCADRSISGNDTIRRTVDERSGSEGDIDIRNRP